MIQPMDLRGQTILVTGSAGFIGANLVLRLLQTMGSGTVVSLDNMCDYYDPRLKEYRLSLIEGAAEKSPVSHVFVRGDICDRRLVDDLFERHRFDVVVSLAAQGGVRYGIDHPDVYIQSNIVGFHNILEACRHSYDLKGAGYEGVRHLVAASSSSVYGSNRKVPFSEDDRVDHPLSLYAATKKSNELMAHAYANLYDIPTTMLRFFTVIGAAGRPDMALMGFAERLCRGETIRIFNHGDMRRDFTDVRDVVTGVCLVMAGAPARSVGADGLPQPPYQVLNIGAGRPVSLLEFVDILQEELVGAGVLPADYDFEGHRELVGMQPGDVPVTYADTSRLEAAYGFVPKIPLRETIRDYCEWHREYYGWSRP